MADYDIKEFIQKKELEAEFKGKKIKFKPISAGDAMIFLDKLLSLDTLSIIQDEDFCKIASKSLGVSVEEFKETYPEFRIFVVEQLMEVVDFPFFLQRLTELANKLQKMTETLFPSPK